MKISFKKIRISASSFIRVSKPLLIDSLLRNFFYMAGILVWLNKLEGRESGFWFMTSSLFWGWYLLPVLALIQITQGKACLYVQRKEAYFLIKNLYKKSVLALSCITIGVTIIFSIFHWHLFSFFSPLNLSEKLSIVKMGKYFLVTYLFFSFNMLLDTFFYATGKTKYMAWQTIFSSFLVLVVPLILERWHLIEISLVWIQRLYFGYLIMDLIFTLIFFCKEIPLLKEGKFF